MIVESLIQFLQDEQVKKLEQAEVSTENALLQTPIKRWVLKTPFQPLLRQFPTSNMEEYDGILYKYFLQYNKDP